MNIAPFLALGEIIKKNLTNHTWQPFLQQAYQENRWFTPENSQKALWAIADMLNKADMEKWLAAYPTPSLAKPKNVGIIMAGNIPAVGFHDALCVLLSGHILHAKLSSSDSVLMKLLLNTLAEIDPALRSHIIYADKLHTIDALIATGSNNSARYFEYYFADKPKIIRKNRTSLAVLSGKETTEDYKKLAEDIFLYYGLGCRNISKLLVPIQYTFNAFFEAIYDWNSVMENTKYANNVDYSRAIYLLNKEPFIENGFLLVKESSMLFSPTGVLFYHTYQHTNEVQAYITSNTENVQCVVSNVSLPTETLPYGTAQYPKVYNYADNIDTIQFLLALH